MNVLRGLSVLGAAVLGILTMAIPATADTCANEVDSTTVTLKKDQSTDNGVQLGTFNCWMPKLPAPDKNLCRNGSETSHAFSITLANQCDLPVKLMLKLKGGGSLDFQEAGCGNSAVLFNEFLAAGDSKPFTCTSKDYSTREGKRATDFELRASHVDGGTGPPRPVNVDYDPEIAVKDPHGFGIQHGLWALAIIVGGLVVWLLVARFRR